MGSQWSRSARGAAATSRGARSDRADPHLEPLRLEDESRGAPRAPARPAGGRPLGLERRAGAARADHLRRGDTRSRGGAALDRGRPGHRRRVRRRVSRAALVAGAAAVFLGSWSLLHHGFLARSQLSDIPTYQRYAVGVRHDELPYRDFKIEYPPGVLPVVLLPSLRMQRDSDQAGLAVWFDREMALAGCLALLGTALCLGALGEGRLRTFVALGIVDR